MRTGETAEVIDGVNDLLCALAVWRCNRAPLPRGASPCDLAAHQKSSFWVSNDKQTSPSISNHNASSKAKELSFRADLKSRVSRSSTIASNNRAAVPSRFINLNCKRPPRSQVIATGSRQLPSRVTISSGGASVTNTSLHYSPKVVSTCRVTREHDPCRLRKFFQRRKPL